jgi:TRAP-type C4-dicarboxylate transport system substrate-binding protein
MRFFAAVAACAFGLALPAGSAQAQDFSMKFATQTLNDMQHEYMKMFKAEVEKRTNGRMKVDIFPAAQLGAAPRQTEGLRLGTIQAAIGPAELFVGADSRFQALAFAGLFKNVEHARKTMDVPAAREAISAVADSRGLVAAAMMVYDLQMVATKQPVATLADFSGKRIRVLASEAEQAMIRSLGGASVPMALPEVLPAIQQGTIDGVTSVMGVFNAFRYYDAAPNVLDTHLWSLMPLTLMNKAWLMGLPPDVQKTIREVSVAIEPELHKWQVKRIADDRANWVKSNGKIVTLSAAEQGEAAKRVSDALQPVLAKDAGLKAFYETLKAAAATAN